MNIVFFDTEFTAWEGSLARRWSRPGEHREVIQIGAVKCRVDQEAWTVLEEFDCLVLPEVNSELSEYVMQLTGITQDSIEKSGLTFSEALEKFLSFVGDPVEAIYSWGTDSEILAESATLAAIPFHREAWPFRDIRPEFQAYGVETTNLESGMICSYLGLDDSCLTGHNASSDATSLMIAYQHLQRTSELAVQTEIK